MNVTVDRIMNLHPCYTRARVEQLWAGHRSLTLTQIATLNISPEDRIWALVRLVPRKMAVARACDCATRVLPIWEAWATKARRTAAEIAAPRKCIATVRAWLRGKATIEQVRRACAATATAATATATATAATVTATAAVAAADEQKGTK